MTRLCNLTDSGGGGLRLGSPVGREGGEACVYEIAGRPDAAAKIYISPPSAEKAEKLREMVRMSALNLRTVCAWPTDLIYTQGDRRLVGLVMPKVAGSEIHNLYNPRARYVHFPKARWDQLVWAARNISAAFDTLHRDAVVMGDVNEGNILVRDDGTVCLIDCDSYQICVNGKHYPCGVGVGLWTPPELQGVSLRRALRTVNHDRFGLAQMIFLLLFMGRYPFAGITSHSEDYDLEQAIQRYLFAYDPNDQRVQPPEKNLRLESLPQDLQTLFQRAFTKGSQLENARPTAGQWCQALDHLRKNLRVCTAYSADIYPVHLRVCPWCDIRNRHHVDFFWTAGPAMTSMPATQDLQAFFTAIRNFQPVARIQERASDVTPSNVTPMPVNLPRTSPAFIWGCVILVACIGVTVLGQPVAFLGVLFALVLISSGREHHAFAKERASRRAILERATGQLALAEKSLSVEFERYDATFHEKQRVLLAVGTRLQNWPKEEAQMRAETDAKKRQLQLHAFLDRILISGASIPNIGDKRKDRLAAYGVESALDVDKTIIKIPGFGQGLYDNLRQWRASCERRFRFDPHLPLPPEAIRDMEQRIMQTRRSLESELRSGPEQLRRLNTAMEMKSSQYSSQLQTLVQAKAQAEADFQVVQ